ncbi:hypothetical protein BKA83DRAFT_687788 [Pisolithus microcarpus]|nr:hypothetical protein BKA83DRAFT_687788 [Pisolithus microcarpus]
MKRRRGDDRPANTYYAEREFAVSDMSQVPRSSDVAVDVSGELAAARAELTRLLNRELELIQETQAVRTAADAQIDRVNQIVKRRLPGPITRLPPSVLSDIIYLTICNTQPASDAHRCTKKELASVSRRWRLAILNCPQLWTTIVIDPSWSSSLVMAHVKRSGVCPLDITITKWSSANHAPQFRQLLGLLVTCGYRWRSLDIRKNSGRFATFIIESIQYMMFPAMKRVEIWETQISGCPLFLTSHYAPVLECMVLSRGNSIDQIPNIAGLRSLRVYLADDMSGSLLLSSLLPLQQLSELVISGTGSEWPEAESIHLPALTSLTLALSNPRPALAAITTPSLIYLGCSRGALDTRFVRARSAYWAHVFRDFTNKFATVRRLRLFDTTNDSSFIPAGDAGDAQAVCAACPGVRQAELPADVTSSFFAKDDTPADHWKDLTELIIKGLMVGQIPHSLARWLIKRKSNRNSPFKVTFCEFNAAKSPGATSGCWLASLDKLLYGHCELVLKEVPLKATLNMNSSTSLVDTRGATTILWTYQN